MAFTDQQIMNMIQFVMIETPNNGATWDSGLWTQTEVIDYLNHRQNRFLKDTHLQIGIANIDAVQGTAEYNLPDDWINTVRVAWIALDGTTKELTRSDVWEADYGIPTWSYVQATPKVYYDGKPLVIKIMPVPNAAGTIQVHYVPLASIFDGTGEIATVPDEFVHPIKYGALTDMFSKIGRANDPRAQYCSQRYLLGQEIARLLLGGWKK